MSHAIHSWQPIVALVYRASRVLTALLSMAMGGSLAGIAAESEIEPVERWSNVFAGEEITHSFLLPTRVGVGRAVGWSVVVETAVIARRETAAHRNADGKSVLTVQFRLPQGESRAVLPVLIVVALGNREVIAKRLWMYPRSPFEDPLPGVNPGELVLFDPHDKTADRWKQLPLKFRVQENVDALAKITSGVVVIGEGVSFREYRGLPRIIGRLARSGVKVLCLAPVGGSLSLAGNSEAHRQAGELPAAPRSLVLKQADVLADFDKRLDYVDWRGEKSPVGSRLQLGNKAGRISAKTTNGADGWSWLEAEYPGGGRIVVSGFHCIEHWDAGPAARHALWRILAYVSRDSDEDQRRVNVAK